MKKKKNARVKLNLKNLNLDELIDYAKQLHQSMSNNPDFPGAENLLKDLIAVVDKAEEQNSEVKGIKVSLTAKQSALDDTEFELVAMLKQAGSFVDSVSKGDESKIKSSGLDVYAPRTKAGLPAAPINLHAGSANSGDVSLSWLSVNRAKSYVVQYTTDISGNGVWEYVVVSTRSKAVIHNLVSGTKYWFRVAAVNSAGQGPWSDPATSYVS